ncbi:MAG TPA: hypothetical protein VGG06_00505 [Thermoanaerobaculia bacterium]|jgi:hypothetical protein
MPGAALAPLFAATPISRDEALQIARRDAFRVYRDLSEYEVHARLEDDGWHVDYELASSELQGGGAHYVIDAFSGRLLSKRYEQ